MSFDIMLKVTEHKAPAVPATLKNYFRSRLEGEIYPGIVEQTGSEVVGKVYLQLPLEVIIERLDVFEGEYYTRTGVEIFLANGWRLDAMTYIIRPEYKELLTYLPWDYELFLQTGKSRFVTDYSGFTKLDNR